MKHTVKCCLKLIDARIRGQLIHRLSLIPWFLGLMSGYIASFAGIWVVMSRFGTIHYWTLEQIAFIYALNMLAYGLRSMFFATFTEISTWIKRGEMDTVLIKPMNPMVYVVGAGYQAGGVAHLLVGVLLFLLFFDHFPVVWTPVNILFFILAIISGALVYAAISIAIAACAFFMVETGGLRSMFHSFREFMWYPVTLYNKMIVVILLTIVPMAFANYVPAGVFLDNPEYDAFPLWFWMISLLAGPVFFALSYWFWNRGINHYQSTGT
jgi:ABC-2 type transport system permease protein